MKRSRLLDIATAFRAGYLKRKNPRGQCGNISIAFAVFMRKHHGMEIKIVRGSVMFPLYGCFHCWNELPDGTFIDLTASQMGRDFDGNKMPDIYFGKLPNGYTIEERLNHKFEPLTSEAGK